MRIATIILSNGDELISYVQDDPNPMKLILHKPVLVTRTPSAMGPYMQVSHYLMFTKQNYTTINRNNVVVLEYDLEDNAIKHYENFVSNKQAPVTIDDSDRFKKLVQDAIDRHTMEEGEIDFEFEESSNTTIH